MLLGQVAEVAAGNPAPQSKELFEQGCYPFVRTSDVGRIRFGVIDDSTDHLNGKGVRGLRCFPRGTILFPKSGASTFLNHRVMLTVDAYVASHLATIVAQPEFAVSKFLLYALATVSAQDLVPDSSYPSLNLSAIESIRLPVPPLPEQHRIVALLDEAFAGIAKARENTERNLENAREVFESHLNAVYGKRGAGWQVRRVGEIAEHVLGKMLDKNKNKGEPRPYLRNINVRWFDMDLSDLLEMRFLPTETDRYTAVNGDVLVCEGGYPGRAAIWQGEKPIYFQKALHRVRFPKPGLNEWFVFYLYAQDRAGELRNHFSGTGIQHFTGEVLRRFPVPIPPDGALPSLLDSIKNLQAETQLLTALYQRKLAALDALKQSLLHQAFHGDL